MDYLSNLTIIIPTLNRHQYCLRGMKYWAKTSINVIYLDGSDTPIQNLSTANLSEKIKYIHLPVGLYERLNHAATLIKTEYTALLGDDEFFLTDAIEACVSRLEHASELVSCCGCALGFSVKDQRLLGFIQYPQLIGHSVSQDRPLDRIVFHMRNYVPSAIYGITRTSVWKEAINIVTKREFSAYAIGEIQFELAVLYFGKTEVVPQLMWLRSHENVANRGQSASLTPENSLVGWWNEGKFLGERKDFVRLMSSALSDSPETIQETRFIVTEGLNSYVKYRESKERADKRKKLYQIAIDRLPALVKKVIRYIIPKKERIGFTQQSLMTAARKIEKWSVSVDFAELELISSQILNFHEEQKIRQVTS